MQTNTCASDAAAAHVQHTKDRKTTYT
jgi:hypothetical protein